MELIRPKSYMMLAVFGMEEYSEGFLKVGLEVSIDKIFQAKIQTLPIHAVVYIPCVCYQVAR